MHSLKTDGFGEYNEVFEGAFPTWKDWFDRWKPGLFSKKDVEEIIDPDLLGRAKNYIEEKKYLLGTNQGYMLHGDITPDNIMIKDGKLSGIIDAADALSGDPMYDVARTHQAFLGSGWSNSFISSYGEIDRGRIKFYGIIISLWDIESKNKVCKTF